MLYRSASSFSGSPGRRKGGPLRGPDGLAPRKASGAKPKIPAALADELRRWVTEGPAQQGLDRANWTHPELADHLYRAHGVRTGRSAVQRLCAKLGIRTYYPGPKDRH